jgi:hypothetical protein
MAEERDNEVTALQRSYEELRRESMRLRDARAAVTRQLGPLPISAGIAISLVAAFSENAEQGPLWLAFVLLFVLIGVGIAYSNMRPYRQLRALKEDTWRKELVARHPEAALRAERSGLLVEDLLPERDWYAAMIQLEREIYGDLNRTDNRHRPPTRDLQDLQDGFDRERTGLFAVQLLFGLVIACLLLSRLLA